MADTKSQLGSIGKNSADEFMETIIYMTAYNQTTKLIQDVTDDIENPILKEAVESAANVAAFSGIFMLIRYEEVLMEKAFAVAETVIVGLLALNKKFIGKLKGAFRGRKLGILSKIVGGMADDNTQKALVISNTLGNFMQGRSNQYSSSSLIDSTFKVRDNVVQKDRQNLELGKSMADNYVNSLLFKTFTSSFTANDKDMIRKILGRETLSEMTIDDMNKIGSFMFTKDDNGNLTGLTEQFFSLISGLGYVTKKN